MVIKKNEIADISLMPKNKETGHFTPVVGVKNGICVDYDIANHDVYWVETEEEDQTNGTLYKTSLGGGDKIDFFANATDNGIVGSPYCVAFDWIGRNMYIGNIEASEISLVRVDGKLKYRMLVLDNRGDDKGVSDPISLTLNPGSGQLFWLDRGGKGRVPTKIGRANMDGTESIIIIRDNIAKPEFLTIDLQKEVLYFSSSQPPKIESCNLDGKNRQTILSSEKNHPIAKPSGIAVFERRLYYVDSKYEKVARVDALDGRNEEILVDNESNLKTLQVFRKRQRKHI